MSVVFTDEKYTVLTQQLPGGRIEEKNIVTRKLATAYRKQGFLCKVSEYRHYTEQANVYAVSVVSLHSCF